MEARNRVGIGFSYRPAGLHILAELILESIPGLLKSFKKPSLKTFETVALPRSWRTDFTPPFVIATGNDCKTSERGGGASFCLKGTQAWEFLWIRWILYFCEYSFRGKNFYSANMGGPLRILSIRGKMLFPCVIGKKKYYFKHFVK